MILSAFSYAGVQEGLFGYLNTRDTILSEIQAHPYESFSFTENGVTLTCKWPIPATIHRAQSTSGP